MANLIGRNTDVWILANSLINTFHACWKKTSLNIDFMVLWGFMSLQICLGLSPSNVSLSPHSTQQ